MNRPTYLRKIRDQFKVHPVVAILGPRQCGKTTLARQFAGSRAAGAKVETFDLEDPVHLARLDQPKLALEGLSGLVIIDEIQRRPDLFPLLRVLVDRPAGKTRFLILGSASRDLIRQGSESLAGRIGFIELPPFPFHEVQDWRRLWFRGGFPRSFLARSDAASGEWLKAYVSTFLERDIPALGIQIPAQTLRRFGFEFKYADAPRVTPSMRIARDDLGLEKLFVIYPGDSGFPLGERMAAVGLAKVGDLALK